MNEQGELKENIAKIEEIMIKYRDVSTRDEQEDIRALTAKAEEKLKPKPEPVVEKKEEKTREKEEEEQKQQQGQPVPGHPGYFVPPPGYYGPWPPQPQAKKEKKETEDVNDLLNKRWTVISNPAEFYWNLLHNPDSIFKETSERRKTLLKVSEKIKRLQKDIQERKKSDIKKYKKLEKEIEKYSNAIINETGVRAILSSATKWAKYLKIDGDPRSSEKSYFDLTADELYEYIKNPRRHPYYAYLTDKKQIVHRTGTSNFFRHVHEYYLEAHKIMEEMTKTLRLIFSQ